MYIIFTNTYGYYVDCFILTTAYNCTDPPASKNTIKACGTWRHGIYCKISCIDPDRYAFTETVPQVYRCGQEGFWDPPRGQIFTFPSCAGKILFQNASIYDVSSIFKGYTDGLSHQFTRSSVPMKVHRQVFFVICGKRLFLVKIRTNGTFKLSLRTDALYLKRGFYSRFYCMV